MEHFSIRKLLIDITFLDPFLFFAVRMEICMRLMMIQWKNHQGYSMPMPLL